MKWRVSLLLAGAVVTLTIMVSAARAQERFSGSVATGTATSDALRLSLSDAIARGMKTNLGALVANQDVRSAQAARGEALSRLLPTINGGISEESQQINLAAFGLNVPGIPQIVGPFGLTDARVTATAPLLNFKSIYNNRAASADQKAAYLSAQDARHGGAGCHRTFISRWAFRQRSRIETGQAQVKSAQAVYDQASDFRTNGVVPAIEVLRAQVELQTEQQRLIAYQNNVDKLKLRGWRVAIGAALDGQAFDLTDTIPCLRQLPPLKLEDAISAGIHFADGLSRAHRSALRPANWSGGLRKRDVCRLRSSTGIMAIWGRHSIVRTERLPQRSGSVFRFLRAGVSGMKSCRRMRNWNGAEPSWRTCGERSRMRSARRIWIWHRLESRRGWRRTRLRWRSSNSRSRRIDLRRGLREIWK